MSESIVKNKSLEFKPLHELSTEVLKIIRSIIITSKKNS